MKIEDVEELSRMEKAATPMPWGVLEGDALRHVLTLPDEVLVVALRDAAPSLLALAKDAFAAQKLLEVAARKMHYVVQQWPGDKESKAWLDAYKLVSAHQKTEG